MSDPRPIGVFDSGVGGLTVLRELQRQLPHESTIYFADLGHFPYGPRYQAQVRTFALNIIRFLEKLDVKLVLDKNGLESAEAQTVHHQIYVTGSPDRFTDVARILFGQDLPPITTVRLELVEAISGREGAA